MTDAELVHLATYRTELADIDAEWWMDRVRCVLEAYENGEADKHEVKRRVVRDLDEAGRILRRGITTVATPRRNRRLEIPVSPLNVVIATKKFAVRSFSLDNSATSRKGAATSSTGNVRDEGGGGSNGGRHVSTIDTDNNVNNRFVKYRNHRPGAAREPEGSKEGAIREAWERFESDAGDTEEDEARERNSQSPSVRASRGKVDGGKEKQNSKERARHVRFEDTNDEDSEDLDEPTLPTPRARKRKGTPVSTPPQIKKKSLRPAHGGPRPPAADNRGHHDNTKAIDTIIIDSDDPTPLKRSHHNRKGPDPTISPSTSSSPTFASVQPTLFLRITHMGQTPICVRVDGEMTLEDVLDIVWKAAPASARVTRPVTALFSADERWPGPWDEGIWNTVVATAAVAPKPPIWAATMKYRNS